VRSFNRYDQTFLWLRPNRQAVPLTRGNRQECLFYQLHLQGRRDASHASPESDPTLTLPYRGGESHPLPTGEGWGEVIKTDVGVQNFEPLQTKKLDFNDKNR